jgi:uncharacterized protein (DUF362 family)
MKNDGRDGCRVTGVSRRSFLAHIGASAIGFLVAPGLRAGARYAGTAGGSSAFLAQVAITQNDNYLRTVIRQKVEHLFDSIGGIADVVRAGDKVAVKINLTGGSGSAASPRLGALPITESMWTHPEVVRAVGELMIDSGVNGDDIFLVEALLDTASFMDFGYEEVRQSLGAQRVNLNATDPYAEFVDLPAGANSFFYSSFRVNGILKDVDVHVSLPKLKEHAEAGLTASLKNQVGMVPKHLYTLPTDNGRRGALHSEGGPSATHLPRSIADLNLARPVHLAVIDGIKNARGGEGVWNPTWQLWQDHVLLAGKDAVATDSVGAYLMGHDPEGASLSLPAGGSCDNHLELLHQRGMGTNRMSEIEVVGDGATLVSVGQRATEMMPAQMELHQNYPNPFNPTTTIGYAIAGVRNQAVHVSLRVYDLLGREVVVLVDGRKFPGSYEVSLDAGGLPSGAYMCRLTAGSFVQTRRMTLLR